MDIYLPLSCLGCTSNPAIPTWLATLPTGYDFEFAIADKAPENSGKRGSVHNAARCLLANIFEDFVQRKLVVVSVFEKCAHELSECRAGNPFRAAHDFTRHFPNQLERLHFLPVFSFNLPLQAQVFSFSHNCLDG